MESRGSVIRNFIYTWDSFADQLRGYTTGVAARDGKCSEAVDYRWACSFGS
jgi:hypothetical protein